MAIVIPETQFQTKEELNEFGVLPADTLAQPTPDAIDPVVASTQPVIVPPAPEYSTKKETEVSAGIKRAQDITAQLAGQSAFRTTAQEEQDIAGKEQTLQDISSRIGMLTAEADQIPLQLQEDVHGRGVTAGGLAPIEAGALRKNAIAQLGANASFQAASGNLTLARDFVDRAVAAEFDPIREQLAVEQANLNLLLKMPDLTAAEKQQVLEVQAKNEAEAAEIERQADERKQISQVMLEASQSGFADDTLLNDIANARSYDEAIFLAGDALGAEAKNKLASENFKRELEIAKYDQDNLVLQKLDNGETVLINKESGNVVENFGGAKPTGGFGGGAGLSGISQGALDKAQLIMNPMSHATIEDFGLTGGERQEVMGALNYLKEEAMKEGDFAGFLAASAGGSNVDGTTVNSLNKAKTVVGQIGDLRTLIAGEDTGPILGMLRSANPYDVKAQAINSQLSAIVPNLARGVYGEVGVLTDKDIEIYSRTLPNIKQKDELRDLVLAMTVRTVQRGIENQLEINAAAGRDVSGFVKMHNDLSIEIDRLMPQVEGSQTVEGNPKIMVVKKDGFRQVFYYSEEQGGYIPRTRNEPITN